MLIEKLPTCHWHVKKFLPCWCLEQHDTKQHFQLSGLEIGLHLYFVILFQLSQHHNFDWTVLNFCQAKLASSSSPMAQRCCHPPIHYLLQLLLCLLDLSFSMFCYIVSLFDYIHLWSSQSHNIPSTHKNLSCLFETTEVVLHLVMTEGGWFVAAIWRFLLWHYFSKYPGTRWMMLWALVVLMMMVDGLNYHS